MRLSSTASHQPDVRSFWPLLLFSAVLLSFAIITLRYSLGIWLSIALAWAAFGLLCWGAVLRYFPPTPLAGDTGPASEAPPKHFELRQIPAMVVLLLPLALISPFLLAFLLIRAQKRHEPRKA